MTFFGTKSVDG